MTEDVLTDGKGECVICLEELQCGDLIARLPCLCIYHKKYVYDIINILSSIRLFGYCKEILTDLIITINVFMGFF